MYVYEMKLQEIKYFQTTSGRKGLGALPGHNVRTSESSAEAFRKRRRTKIINAYLSPIDEHNYVFGRKADTLVTRMRHACNSLIKIDCYAAKLTFIYV